ncbi:MAG: putative thioredoxin [Cyclobacteriaceae bacterium]|jgi:putative thioredoxin
MQGTDYIIEVTAPEFQAEVVEKSRKIPVLLEFYAPDAEPSMELAPVLRKLAGEFKGKFRLARVNVQAHPEIVQQLGVRTLPTVKVIVNAHMVQELEGPQTEEQLRHIIEPLTMSPAARIRDQIGLLLANGDRQGAIAMLQEAIGKEPQNYVLHVELADLLTMENRIDEARQILASLPKDTDGIAKPKNRIEFIEGSASLPALDALHASVIASPDELQLKYDLAVRLIADDQIEEALETLLAMLIIDKEFGEALARKTMIKVFELLGKGDPIATAYRRKMFTFLH